MNGLRWATSVRNVVYVYVLSGTVSEFDFISIYDELSEKLTLRTPSKSSARRNVNQNRPSGAQHNGTRMAGPTLGFLKPTAAPQATQTARNVIFNDLSWILNLGIMCS